MRGDDGAALVEFALVMPFLVVVLLGTVTSGLALNDDIQLTHSAREGARYGATVPDDESFGSGTWATNVRKVVVDRFGGGITAVDVCVSLVQGSPAVPLSANHTTDAGGAACYDDSASGVTSARVQVTAERDVTIDTGLYSIDVTLESEAVAQHESNG
jgi:Flp pilus assembly protein TadG